VRSPSVNRLSGAPGSQSTDSGARCRRAPSEYGASAARRPTAANRGVVVMDLVPGDSLITDGPNAGRQLAIALARRSVRAIQPDDRVLAEGRIEYSADPDSLIAAALVVAIEFATIAAANGYWRRE
jgi:hypothetical protein